MEIQENKGGGIKCSFLLTTFNKLESLTEILTKLIGCGIPNTEIVVVDGFSSDGTIEYLTRLKLDGLIDVLVIPTERDLGEWDGYNKALKHSSGDYIKLITDDDAFDYEATSTCLDFLYENPKVDWLNSQGYNKQGIFHYSGYHEAMKDKNSTKPHVNGLTDGICGLGFFIKREITKNLDLFNDNYGARTDKQLSLELTTSEYIGSTTNVLTWIRLLNEKSNTTLYGGSLVGDIKEVDKSGSINMVRFKEDLSTSLSHLKVNNENINKEFIIF